MSSLSPSDDPLRSTHVGQPHINPVLDGLILDHPMGLDGPQMSTPAIENPSVHVEDPSVHAMQEANGILNCGDRRNKTLFPKTWMEIPVA